MSFERGGIVMDISTMVVVLVLIATFLVAVVWMEIHSRKTGSKERSRNTMSSESGEEQKKAIYENR